MRLPTNINELIARFLCDNLEKCMFRKCEKCSSYSMSCKNLNVDLVADSDPRNSTISINDCDENGQAEIIAFYEWTCQGTKLKKTLFKKISIVRSETTTPQRLHSSIAYTTIQSLQLYQKQLGQELHTGMLSLVTVIKINSNMKLRVPTLVTLFLA